MRSSFPAILASSALLLSGCASVVSGGSQAFTISTDPEGAACKVTRGGALIAEVPRTPDTIRLSRSSNGIEIACARPGYAVAQAAQPSNLNGWLIGNLFIGGLVGVFIDFTTGAAYRYGDGTLVAMQPVAGAPNAVAYAVPPGPRAYWPATRTEAGASADPIVVPPASPQGDVTYRWGNTAAD